MQTQQSICARIVELEQENTRLQQYLSIASVIVVVIKADQNVDFINQKGCELLGYAEDDVLGKNWFEVCLPLHRQHEIKQIFAQLMNGNIAPVEYVEESVVTRSGEERLISWQNTVLRDESGHITGTLSSGYDITERRKAEEELQRTYAELERRVKERTAQLARLNQDLQSEISERRQTEDALREQQRFIERIVETSPNVLYIYDLAEHRNVYANREITDALGYTPAQIQEMGAELFQRILHPDDADAVAIHHTTLNSVGKHDVRELIYRMKHADGGWRWLHSRDVGFTYDAEGCCTQILGVAEDITARKQAEEALRASEEKFHTLYDSMSEGVCLHELLYNDAGQAIDYRVLDANAAYESILHLRKADVVNRLASELYGSDEAPYLDLYATVADTGKPVMFETYFPPMDQYFTIRVFSPGTGKFATVFSDITERKRTEQEVQQLNEELDLRVQQRTAELEAANKELQDFAYVTSHDLKAPLRGISRLAQWLVTDYADKFDEDGQNMVEMLVNRTVRMDNLIDAILEYSRIGRIGQNPQLVDMNEVLHEVIDTLAPPAHISIVIDTMMPVIALDRTRIIQVFQNLLSNAITFSDKPEGRIIVVCHDAGAFWEFSVRDNGPGIEPKYYEKIFQIFQTLQARDMHESTGVGLALVKKIIESYGGAITVESMPGQGTTFMFTLPKKLQHTDTNQEGGDA